MWAQLLTRRVGKQTKKKKNVTEGKRCARIGYNWTSRNGFNSLVSNIWWCKQSLLIFTLLKDKTCSFACANYNLHQNWVWFQAGEQSIPNWPRTPTPLTSLGNHEENNLFQTDRKCIMVSDTDMATVTWAFDTLTLFTQISFSKTHYIRRISAESIWHNGMLIKRNTLCKKY